MLECERQLFSLPDDLHCLNRAYVSPLPRSVQEVSIAGTKPPRLLFTGGGAHT